MKSYYVPSALVAGSLLSYSAMFMAVSVLALFLSEQGLAKWQVGLVLGTMALVASALGFLGGRLADVVTERVAVSFGACLSGAGYAALAHVSSFAALLPVAAMVGLARSVSEPSMKSLLASYPFPGRPDLVFRLRYMSICLGAVVGPMAALLFPSKRAAITGTGFALVAYGLAFALVSARLLPARAPRPGAPRPAAKQRSPALRDRRLHSLIAAGLVVFLVFSLFDSMVPLALAGHVVDASHRFSILLTTNAVLGLGLQLPATWINRRLSTRALAVVGCVCFSLAFLLFASSAVSFLPWIAGVILFSCGEALTLPAGEILIDAIAPEEHRASYFGLAELRQLGFFAGPAFGGLVLQLAGQQTLFIGGAVIMSAAALLYQRSQAAPVALAPVGGVATE